MFYHVLAPLDGSLLAECVIPHTLAIAQAFHSRVTLLRVLKRPSTDTHELPVDPLDWQIKKAEAAAYLERQMTRFRELGLSVERKVLEGGAADNIVRFVHQNNVDLIILSSHGRSGLSGWNVSSVVQKIILRAYTSVMIVRAYHPTDPAQKESGYKRLLVPIDGSQRAEYVLPVAGSIADFFESQLILAHIVRRPEMPRRVPLTQKERDLIEELEGCNRAEAEKCLTAAQSQIATNTETRLLVADHVSETLEQLAEQENVDLVVMNAHGYSGKTKWPYGSVATNFIAYGTTPLIIVQDLAQDQIERTQAEIATGEFIGH